MKCPLVLAFTLSVIPTIPSFAIGSESVDSLLGMSFEDLLNIQISGPTRTLKKINDAPASVTVFTRSEIQNMGVDFFYELLSYVPGFQTSRDNDFGASYYYSSRGSDTSQDTTAILLMVDGIPKQEFRNASASTFSGLMSVDRIERVEFIRGPGSALYGSGAFLGVINVITVKGNNRIKTQLGEFDRQELQGQISTKSEDWRFDAFLYNYRDSGETHYLNDRLESILKETSDPQVSENYVVNVGYLDSEITFEHINVESEEFYLIGAINNAINTSEHYQNNIAFKQGFQWFEVKSDIQLSYSEERQTYTSAGTREGQLASISTPSSNDPLIGELLYEGYSWQLQWLNDWWIDDRSSVQFGMEQSREALTTAKLLSNYNTEMLINGIFPIEFSSSGNVYERDVLDLGDRDIYGIYAQLQHRWNAKTDITLGARYDDYEEFDGQPSFRFALVRKLSDTQVIKFMYGEAFRTPSLSLLKIRDAVTAVKNPNLKPETIRTTEVAWLVQHSKSSFSASAFHNVIEDRIDSSGFDNDGRRMTVNVGEEYSKGLELEGALQWDQNWLIRAGFTEFFTLPDSSFRESERLASLIINYNWERWWVNFSGYYNSDREMPGETGSEIDGFTVINLKTGFRFPSDIRTFVQVKNLMDESIGSSPQSTSISNPIPYRGRELSVGFEWAF